MWPLSRRAWLAVGISLALLCSIRALLPVIVERRVVAALARNERYAGSFDDVDVSVLRLAYSIENLRLVKRSGQIPVPFVIAPRVEYTFDRLALLRGRIAGTIAISSPSLSLVDGPTPELRQGPMGVDWRITMRKLFPTRVNRIDIHDGTIHFRNFHTQPEVDVYLDHVEIGVSNLGLGNQAPERGTVDLHGRAVPMKTGSIAADLTLYRNTRRPSFDATVSIQGARIAEWNSFLSAYIGLDVQAGSARIEVELRSRDGQLKGFVKPTLSDLEVLDFPGEVVEQSPLKSLREGLVDFVAALLQDPKRHEIETVIPISGTIRSPVHDDWASVIVLVRNAFIAALKLGAEVLPDAR